MRHKGVWGTVCNENFKQGEAAVFCRMMGYDGKASFGVVNTVKEKKGSWPIWISMRPEWPDCQGTENSIEECHKTELWSDDDSCHHAEDVVLTCQVQIRTQSPIIICSFLYILPLGNIKSVRPGLN